MILRVATHDDVEALVDVQEHGAVRGLSHIFPQDAHPFPRMEIVRRWHDEIADPLTHAYVATIPAGAVSGFAATRGTEMLHFGTAVHTWGTGLAGEFHDALLRVLATTAHAGTTRIRLRVFEANLRARRFYEKLGWRPTGHNTRTSFPPHPVLLGYDRAMAAEAHEPETVSP